MSENDVLPERGEDSRTKRSKDVAEILIRTSKSYQDSVLWAWLEKLVPVLNQHIIECHIFSAQYPKSGPSG